MSYYNIKTGTHKATGKKVAYAAIRYDADAIAAIKALPGRTYSPASKSWIVPVEHADVFRAIVDAAYARYLASLPGPRGNSYNQEHADEIALNGARR